MDHRARCFRGEELLAWPVLLAILVTAVNDHVPKAADHTQASFLVKNGRSDRVTFSTETGSLIFSGYRIPNSEPVTLLLAPGETRSVDTRFDFVFRDHAGLIRQGAAAIFVPGEAVLPDGRRVDFQIPVSLRPR